MLPLLLFSVPALLTVSLPQQAQSQQHPEPRQHAEPDLAARPAAIDLTQPRLAMRLLPGADIEPLANAMGAEVVRSRPDLGLHLLAVEGASEAMVQSLAIATKGVPTVLYASVDEDADPPETLGCGASYDPNTVSAQQCTIAFIDVNPLATTYTAQYAAQQINASQAHALATGVPLVVAVIDSGLDLSHPLFNGRIAPGGFDYILGVAGGGDVANGLDDDGDGMVDEGAGHGTHVAGLTLLGDPNAMIMPMRVLDSDGNGSAFLVAAAIYDAVDQGAAVVNLSLSMRHKCDVVAEALMYAEYHGVTVLTSSGNSGASPDFPGSYHPANFPQITPTWLPSGTTLTGENMIAVTAVDTGLIKPDFACYGASVDVATGGYDVYSAQLGGAYAWWSGTSMSCGLASGAASYLLSIWGQGSYSGTIEDLLKQTATDLDALNPTYAGGMGDGLIDLEAAATLLLGL